MAKNKRPGKTEAARSILDKYERMKRTLGEAEGTALICEIVAESITFLRRETKRLPLRSLVEEKNYFAFRHGDSTARVSRPVNEALFISDGRVLLELLEKLKANPSLRIC